MNKKLNDQAGPKSQLELCSVFKDMLSKTRSSFLSRLSALIVYRFLTGKITYSVKKLVDKAWAEVASEGVLCIQGHAEQNMQSFLSRLSALKVFRFLIDKNYLLDEKNLLIRLGRSSSCRCASYSRTC